MILQFKQKGPFKCIHCLKKESRCLYRVYGGTEVCGSNKIPADSSHIIPRECSKCGKPIDNYLELDNSIVFLDALLLKSSLFCHCLLNCQLKNLTCIKLFILFVLSDTLFKVMQKESFYNDGYLKFEIAFYYSLFKSIIDNILLYFFIIIYYKLIGYIFSIIQYNFFKSFIPICHPPNGLNEIFLLEKCLVFSSYYKLFNIILCVWPSEFQDALYSIVTLLHLTALAQCIKTVQNGSMFSNLNSCQKSRFSLPFASSIVILSWITKTPIGFVWDEIQNATTFDQIRSIFN